MLRLHFNPIRRLKIKKKMTVNIDKHACNEHGIQYTGIGGRNINMKASQETKT